MSTPHNPHGYPSKAEFGVGPYADSSGFYTSVGYDLSDAIPWANCIRIDGAYNVTVPVQHADALIAAIRYSADAILAARESGDV
jgi:hypothetical protein